MNHMAQRGIAFAALCCMLPLMITIGICVRADSTGPVIYRASRIGRDGERFLQLKFRTMYANADHHLGSDLTVQTGASRVTRVGRILRPAGLDELPQLFNVLTGDMNLVGPRPMLPELAAKIPAAHPRFSVRPGLTGLAQVSGRNSLPWSERLDADAAYARDRSTALDFKILSATVRVLVLRQGFEMDRNPQKHWDVE